MARGQQRNQPLIREAGQALNRFKYEVAQEIAQTP
ncbi:MAG TPA: small, acid-soluble spore protein, alpha/beta type, partial [Limnochordia bacterium]|nr:small, acid-soluble spore protein, alpha/beta type [Limnochordia bacterium]